MDQKEMEVTEPPTLRRIRLVLLLILVVGTAGTLAELVLLDHVEDAKQLIPVVLCGFGFVIGAANLVKCTRATVRGLQLLMAMFLLAGVAGVILHYQANVEFQLELDPTLAGRALLWQVLQAKSPPALSPAVMIQLGLVGFAYCVGHPALRSADLFDADTSAVVPRQGSSTQRRKVLR